MKRNTDILAGILGLIAQSWIGVALYLAHSAFRHHWGEVLDGKPLPWITQVSIEWMRFIPVVAAVLLVVVLLVPLQRKHMLWWTCGITLVESLALSIVMVALCVPVWVITYSQHLH